MWVQSIDGQSFKSGELVSVARESIIDGSELGRESVKAQKPYCSKQNAKAEHITTNAETGQRILSIEFGKLEIQPTYE